MAGVSDRAGAGRSIWPAAALEDARDAFAVRMSLARSAERWLDVRYYIWRGDLMGERIAALDAHPDIQVRLSRPSFLAGTSMIDDTECALARPLCD